MLEDLKKKYPQVDFIDNEYDFDVWVKYGRKVAALSPECYTYFPITHTEPDGYEMIECGECGQLHSQEKYREVIDVPIEKLSATQKRKQRKLAEDIIKQLLQ